MAHMLFFFATSNPKNNTEMKNAIVLSPQVINRLKNMSIEEQRVLLDTLISDEVLCVERSTKLTAVQELVYMIFHDNVMRDSRRYAPPQPCCMVS